MNEKNETLSPEEIQELQKSVQENIIATVNKEKKELEDKQYDGIEPLNARVDYYLHSLYENNETLHVFAEYEDFLTEALEQDLGLNSLKGKDFVES